jgi:hypothetical protein
VKPMNPICFENEDAFSIFTKSISKRNDDTHESRPTVPPRIRIAFSIRYFLLVSGSTFFVEIIFFKLLGFFGIRAYFSKRACF